MYRKENPFLGSLKERVRLCRPGSTKETVHVVLDLTGSNLTYQVGDSVGVYAFNEPKLVERTLKAAFLLGDELIVDKRSGLTSSLSHFLSHQASITDFSRKFLTTLL